jgi:hypothetical protein
MPARLAPESWPGMGRNTQQHAFREPAFYENAVGGVSSVGLSLLSGFYVSEPAAAAGPWAPFIIAGTVVVTGAVSFVGGKTATHEMFELIAPEMLRRRERLIIAIARDRVNFSISTLSTLQKT